MIIPQLTSRRGAGLQAATPAQHEALENARLVLSFIEGRGEAESFGHYVERFDREPPRPAMVFGMKEEADAWLKNHFAPPHGVGIEVAGSRYTLAYLPEFEHRKLRRPPSTEELTGLAPRPKRSRPFAWRSSPSIS